MDSTGVPKKVNRHVYKILLSGTELDLFNILDSVKYSMRDLVPVENFEDAVRRSLYNFEQNGIVEKCGNNFKITVTAYNNLNNINEISNNSKKRKLHDIENNENDKEKIITNVQKRFRIEQIQFNDRKGRKVVLPKVRHSNLFIENEIESKTIFDEPNLFNNISESLQSFENNVQCQFENSIPNPDSNVLTRKLDTIFELEEEKSLEENIKEYQNEITEKHLNETEENTNYSNTPHPLIDLIDEFSPNDVLDEGIIEDQIETLSLNGEKYNCYY